MVSKFEKLLKEVKTRFSVTMNEIKELVMKGVTDEDRQYIISKLEDSDELVRAVAWHIAVLLLENNKMDKRELIKR